MMKFVKYLTAVCFLVSFSLHCGAQRLVPGQWETFAGGGVSFIGEESSVILPHFAEIGFNRVGYDNKMVCRVNGRVDRWTYTSAADEAAERGSLDIDTRSYDLYASWGYLWNLAHSRSRAVNLWGGVTVDAGARVRVCMVPDNPAMEERLPAAGVLMGFSPELCLEFFGVPRMSAALFFRPHFQWLTRGKDFLGDSNEKWFYPQCGLQLHYYVFVGK